MKLAMRSTRPLAALGLGFAAAALAVMPVHAEDTPVPAAPTTTAEAPAPAVNVTVLPLFGTQLAVNLVSDGTGALTEVNLSNVDGYTATMVKPNRVAFVSTDGTSSVVVKNRPDGGQRVEARAGTLAGVSGPGSWTGDVFGDGGSTTVGFTVSELADGPDLAITSVSDATAQIGEVRREVDGDEADAGVRIRFSKGTLTRELRIRASVETGDDGTPRARLTVTLGRLRDVPVGGDGQPIEAPKPGEAPEPGEAAEPGEAPKAPEAAKPGEESGKQAKEAAKEAAKESAKQAKEAAKESAKQAKKAGKEPKRSDQPVGSAPSVNTPISSTTEPRRNETTTTAPATTAPATTAPATTTTEDEDG